MLGNSIHLAIPRRVVVYYLLFSLLGIFWLTVSVFLIARAVLSNHRESDVLSYLGQAASTANLELTRGDQEDLQRTVERFGREHSFLYAAIVSPDNVTLAHTQRGRLGTTYQTPIGEHFVWGELEAVRFAANNGQFVREYRAPLVTRGKSGGSLRLAVEDPTLWTSLRSAAVYTPLALLVPMVVVGLGVVTLQRLIRPLDAIDSQLRRAATAITVEDVDLHEVPAGTAGAVGWNRLVEHFGGNHRAGGLERRLSESVQSLRQEHYDDVLNSLTDGVAVTDRDGHIRFVNQALIALCGDRRTPEQLLGESVEEWLALPSHGECISPFVDSARRERHLSDEIERQRGGVRQVLRVARDPIRTADHSPAGYVWSVRDVTQQKLAEEMRSQFLDSATHELRTPLANIKAYAETLALSDVLEIESQKEFCNTINSEATRLARFIDDLLSISSMEAGSLTLDRTETDPERLFREVIAKVKPHFEKKSITLETIYPEKYPPMRLDKDKINVAMVNLLGNAAKYTSPSGHVAFRVKIEQGQLRFEVQDNGVGIAPDELPKVFEKFFRSANVAVQSETGTGLGLSMAREVIRLHGGELTVQSQLGVGTTFVAVMPLK